VVDRVGVSMRALSGGVSYERRFLLATCSDHAIFPHQVSYLYLNTLTNEVPPPPSKSISVSEGGHMAISGAPSLHRDSPSMTRKGVAGGTFKHKWPFLITVYWFS